MTRIFAAILFIALVSCNGNNRAPVMAEAEPANEAQAPQMGSGGNHAGKVDVSREKVSVELEKGVVSIENLYQKKDSFEGKVIKMKGKVVKVNPAIMGKNWVHIQDGTENNGNYDLTITTEQIFEIGSVVTVSGKIVLNKDFGYGYKYDILMEEAVKVE